MPSPVRILKISKGRGSCNDDPTSSHDRRPHRTTLQRSRATQASVVASPHAGSRSRLRISRGIAPLHGPRGRAYVQHATRQLRPRFHTELAEDFGEVVLDGALADEDLRPDP